MDERDRRALIRTVDCDARRATTRASSSSVPRKSGWNEELVKSNATDLRRARRGVRARRRRDDASTCARVNWISTAILQG